jgi:hypothetical protein
MKRRLRMMAGTAVMLRPTLRAAWAFAPNRAARRKASEAMRLYSRIFGKPKLADHIRSAGLLMTGTLEFARTLFNKVLGRESIVRQPPCRRTEYRVSALESDSAQASAMAQDSAAPSGAYSEAEA